MNLNIERVVQRFRAQFGNPPEVIAGAPGRINIIGEHTDYNDGYVLPMAIERYILVLARNRDDKTLVAYSENREAYAEGDLEHMRRHPRHSWMDYVVGVVRELHHARHTVRGADLFITGDIPMGAGLGSSASLEMAALMAFQALNEFTISPEEMPRLGQRVENDFLELNTGLMDQFIVCNGKAGHALFLDCRSLAHEHVSCSFDDATFALAHTGITRELTRSKYNERVSECMQAVNALNKSLHTKASHLRDFTLDNLEAVREGMDPVIAKRARHVLSEIARTLEACTALRESDAPRLGRLMSASHKSLRHDFEVSSTELDTMCLEGSQIEGCYGGRMMGGGFGGCAVFLVAREAAPAFSQQVLERYQNQTGREGHVILSNAVAGARLYQP